jgi:hypothetical protein
MDTIKTVADLEQRLAEQEEINQDLTRELCMEKEQKHNLEMELLDLDHDNLLLQNQIEEGSGGEANLDDDFVILRDIECQTDSSHLVLLPPPEQQILSVVNRLTYCKVVIFEQEETIAVLEGDLRELGDENRRIVEDHFEAGLEVERLSQVCEQRGRVIHELYRRVDGLEKRRTAAHLTKTVNSLAKAATRSVPFERGASVGSTSRRQSFMSQESYPSTKKTKRRKSIISTQPENRLSVLIEAPVVSRDANRKSYLVSPWDFA